MLKPAALKPCGQGIQSPSSQAGLGFSAIALAFHTLERHSSHTESFNYLTGQLVGRLGHGASQASLSVSFLSSAQPRSSLTVLELNPHPLIRSQDQLATSMLTLLTVHFSYLIMYILILIRARCFVMGIFYQQLQDWHYVEFTDLQSKHYIP